MDNHFRTYRVGSRSVTRLCILEVGCRLCCCKIIRNIDWCCCWCHATVWHFFWYKSRRLTISFFVFLVSKELWHNDVIWNGTLIGECFHLFERLVTMLDAFLLELKKAMFWTASDQRFLLFLSSFVSRVFATLLDWPSYRDCGNSCWYSVSHSASQHGI